MNKEVVVIVYIDTDGLYKAYDSHRVFESLPEALSYKEGMEAAWKINRGSYDCWRPFVLSLRHDYEEWKEMGCPGKEIISKYLS